MSLSLAIVAQMWSNHPLLAHFSASHVGSDDKDDSDDSEDIEELSGYDTQDFDDMTDGIEGAAGEVFVDDQDSARPQAPREVCPSIRHSRFETQASF